MTRILTFAISLFLAVICWRQHPITNGTITNGTRPSGAISVSNGNLNLDSTGNVLAIGSSGIGALVWTGSPEGVARLVNGNNYVTPETRKDDGKGPTLAMVKKAAHRLDDSQMAPALYASMARSVGAYLQAEEAEMLDAIHQADLTTFDYEKVDNYLYRQALKQGTSIRWVWKPVKESDVETLTKDNTWSIRPGVGLVYPKTYGQKIPLRALAEMKAVLDKIPDAIFVVSDYEVVKPDPFLAVTTQKLLAAGKIWIVDCWDEPSFGEALVVPAGQIVGAN